MTQSANCWPTTTQQLLLRAAILPSPQAAWAAYCEKVDLQKAPYVDTCFFSLVYSNFKKSDTVQLKTCKSKYRHTWSQNNFHLFQVKKALELLQSESVPTTLLKGSAMILYYYQDPGLRVIGDIDLLVPKQKAKKAVELLLAHGWSLLDPVSNLDRWIHRSHGVHLRNKEGTTIDLHWSILSESGLDPLLGGFQYKTIDLPAYHTTILASEDQLLHTLFHGMRYSPVPLIRWIPDALAILQKASRFNWDYFIAQIEKLKITLPLLTALGYLQSHEFIQLPSTILRKIETYIPDQVELSYFQFLTSKPKPLSIIQHYWHSHRRNSPSKSSLSLLFSLPSFIKRRKNYTHWYQLIPFAFKGAWIHCKAFSALRKKLSTSSFS